VKKEIGGKIPLIGFAGAPFTLASYVVEGGHSRHYLKIKKLMYENSEIFKGLLEKISRNISVYLKAQAEAGADAVQLFDSWAGTLSPADYKEYVFSFTQRCIAEFKKAFPDKPLIYFSTGTSGLLEVISDLGSDVVGVDWRVDIGDAFSGVSGKAVQGNLDPVALTSSKEIIEKRAREILEKVGKKKGHIFNLGHGVLPQTPEKNVGYLVDFVHEYSERVRSS
jgi:uroporphyrinogen decarboxylase